MVDRTFLRDKYGEGGGMKLGRGGWFAWRLMFQTIGRRFPIRICHVQLRLCIY